MGRLMESIPKRPVRSEGGVGGISDSGVVESKRMEDKWVTEGKWVAEGKGIGLREPRVRRKGRIVDRLNNIKLAL